MMNRVFTVYMVMIGLLLGSTAGAVETPTGPPKTIAEAYPRLALGVLTFAKATELPPGLLLRSSAIQLHDVDVNKVIDAQAASLQDDLRKNAHLILTQLAIRDILLQRAKETLARQGQNGGDKKDSDIIQDYFEKTVLAQVTVTDAEVRELYEADKSMFGGATFEQMKANIKPYLLDQKKQEAVTQHIRDLGKSTPIEVSATWLRGQDVLARDNPVDKARDSGMPSLVDFGATGCGPCDMMTPILKTLTTQYEGKLNVLFVHVRENQVLGARYGIQTIPVQVFFDKAGHEVFRHVGFFAQEQIEKKLAEMGVE